MIPFAEDFASIATELKRIEAEKKPVPPLDELDVTIQRHDLTYAGWLAPYNAGLDGPDYDPA